jgi:TolB-like protein
MKYILSVFFLLIFTGCSSNLFQFTKDKQTTEQKQKKTKEVKKTKEINNELNEFSDLNMAINSIASQLFSSNVNKENDTKIILTSFVELNDLDKTTSFGRLISESMYNELHIRSFVVTDFRGQDAVSVTKDGEFHITRDVEKLKDQIESIEYILVGTYIKFEHDSILVNARILDSISGKIISTGRVVYTPNDCEVLDLCEPKEPVIVQKPVVNSNFSIDIKKDKN